jgi:hypothetical protein
MSRGQATRRRALSGAAAPAMLPHCRHNGTISHRVRGISSAQPAAALVVSRRTPRGIFGDHMMGKAALILLLVVIVVIAGGVVVLGTADTPPPKQLIEQPVPDDRLSR